MEIYKLKKIKKLELKSDFKTEIKNNKKILPIIYQFFKNNEFINQKQILMEN